MTFSLALLLTVLCFRNTLAVPLPDADPSTCTDIKYTVEKAEYVPGQMLLSGDNCKNDFKADPNGRCQIGPTNWDQWAIIPLVSKNLVGAGSTYNLSQIAADANSKLGYDDAAPAQLSGATDTNYCDGALECGLTVTPQYVHITGTRSFGATCDAPQASEPYEMWLPKQKLMSSGLIAEVETTRCYKGAAPAGQSDMVACPTMDPWTEQVVPNVVAAGTFAKLAGESPHGSGRRYRIRFNSDNTKFGTKGQALLTALNDKVYKAGAATAYAGNWQEWTDSLSDIAEFDFDAPDGTSLANTCNAVAGALESVSGLGNSGMGTCT